jgi:hypothetical protein
MADDQQPVGVASVVHHVSQDTNECCAALVTRVFKNDDDSVGFGSEDLGTIGVTFFSWADGSDMATSYECQEKPIPGTWHWPERCPR